MFLLIGGTTLTVYMRFSMCVHFCKVYLGSKQSVQSGSHLELYTLEAKEVELLGIQGQPGLPSGFSAHLGCRVQRKKQTEK